MLVSILPFCSSTPQQWGLSSEIQHSHTDMGAVFFARDISFLFTTLLTGVYGQSWGLLVKVPSSSYHQHWSWRCRSSLYASSSLQHHKAAVTIIQNNCLLPMYLDFGTARLDLFCWPGCEERKALCVGYHDHREHMWERERENSVHRRFSCPSDNEAQFVH
jgi:hypothetical protein